MCECDSWYGLQALVKVVLVSREDHRHMFLRELTMSFSSLKHFFCPVNGEIFVFPISVIMSSA